MASYFLSTRSKQERGELHAGAYIARIATGLGLLTEQVRREVLLPPIPAYLMGRDVLLGMRIIESFGGHHRWSIIRGVIWVRPPPVLEMPEAAHQDPGAEEHPPPPPPPPPPEPRPVYRSVRIPESLQDTIQTMRRDIDRLHDLMMWQVKLLTEIAQAHGLSPQALPAARVYPGPPPRAGTHDHEASGSGTHHEDADAEE